MKSSHVLAICVVTALVLSSNSFTEAAEGTYDYSDGPFGPANWGNLPGAGTCSSGTMQSPMAITDNIVADSALDKNLRTTAPMGSNTVTVSNNNKTVEVTMTGLTLKIGSVTYESAQFHLHYPSEHIISGNQFPLELHLVHIDPVSGQIAVIGWFFILGEKSDFFDQFFNNLPSPGEEVSISPLRFTLSSKGTYGRYMGSLTTPPCSENVVWTLLLRNFYTVSAAQIAQLKAVLANPNARPVQPANGRDLHVST